MPSLYPWGEQFRWAFAWGLGLQLFFFQTPSIATPVFDAARLGQNLPNVVGQDTSSSATSACSYAMTDTFAGPNQGSNNGYGAGPFSTEAIGAGANNTLSSGGANDSSFVAMPTPPTTDASNNLSLSFRGGSWSSTTWYNGTWTSSTASPLNTPVPCTGTYQVFFTLQLQPAFYGGNQNPPQAAPTITVYPCVQTTDGQLVYGSLLSGGVCPGTGPYFTFNPVCNGGNYCSVVTFPFATQVHLTAGQIVGPPAIHTSAAVAVTGGEFSVYYVGP